MGGTRTFACIALVIVFIAIAVSQVVAQTMENFVEEIFERAILKVDVSAPNPVFDADGNNICKSEGTAFVIGDQIAVTASHVYALDPGCGSPVISLESRGFNAFGEVIAVHDDITLLKISRPITETMCALALNDIDVARVDGIRFGIPGGMEFPTPMPVHIGTDDGNFRPFVQLTPTPAEHGESGGPVIFMFNVVGILRARHAQFPAFSVMTPVGQLQALLLEQSITLNARLCNPVELHFFRTDNLNFAARIRVPGSRREASLPPSAEFAREEAEAKGLVAHMLPSGDDDTTVIVIQSNSSAVPETEPRDNFNPQPTPGDNIARDNWLRINQLSDDITAIARRDAWYRLFGAAVRNSPGGCTEQFSGAC
ncbi:hypothetical protein [Rhizobium leguminosarum]